MTDPADTAWLRYALYEWRANVREVPGPGANPRFVMYDAVTTLKATSDEIPWCSSFACWCMESAQLRSPRSAAAADWMAWGEPSLPRLGAVAVFKRVGGHHVAFFLAQIADTIVVLGGNQGNAVSVAPMSGAMLIDLRWPSTT